MKTLYTLTAAAVLALSLAGPAVAQTTLNSTTLGAAVSSATDPSIRLASVSNISVGDYITIVTGDVVREVALVRSIASPYVTVTRAVVPIPAERSARLHASGSLVYTGAKARFYGQDASGSCTSTAETYTPRVNIVSGYVFTCSPAGVWYRHDQVLTRDCFVGVLVTANVDQSCWIVDGNYVLLAVQEVHTTAESAGTLTLIVRRQQGTEAAASGDALITAIDMVGAGAVAQTVKTATLTTTSSLLLLSAGERLGLDFTDDVAGELAGVLVTFKLARR